MGLFDFFRGEKSAPDPKIDHPVFGRIQQVDDELWEGGRLHFAPTDSQVGVMITAPAGGPDERHLQFVAELAQRWPAFLRAAEPIARRMLHHWIENVDTGEIWPRLQLESLHILPRVSADQKWEVMFWCEEAQHWLVIAMKGWTPEGAHVDG